MPILNAEERLVQLCTQFEVNACDGFVDISSTGKDSILSLSGNSIQNSSTNCFLSLNSEANAGYIVLSTAVGASDSSIQMVASGLVNASQCAVSPQGILLMYGPPAALGSIQLLDGEMLLGMGNPATGSLIAITPDSITLKVGTTTLTLTAEGIIASSGDTQVAISPDGVTEEMGAVSRMLGAEGHTLTAAEVSVVVGMSGLTAQGPTASLAFDASAQLSGAMVTESGDAMLTQQAAMISSSS